MFGRFVPGPDPGPALAWSGGRAGARWNLRKTAPWAVLNPTPTTKLAGNHLGLNPDAAELLVGGSGVIRVYHLPEIFSANQLTRRGD
jgi:hypothetical protein